MSRKDRQSRSRSWAPGLLAAFWVLLAGFSGAYLFRVVTGDAVEGREIEHVSAVLTGAEPNALSPEQVAALLKVTEVQRKELSALRSSLKDMSRQVAELSEQNSALSVRLKPIERLLAAPSSGGAATTSPPSPPAIARLNAPEPVAEVEPVAPEEKPAEPPAAEQPTNQTRAPDASKQETEAPMPEPVVVAPEQVAPSETQGEPESASASPSGAETEAAEAPPPAASTDTPDPVPEEQVELVLEEETEIAAINPALKLPPGTTRFGIELGTVKKRDGLRTLWREVLTNHAALVAGLQARRVLAPDKKWRLIAGPFASAEEATQACVLFKRANRSCEATVFAGDAL
jgi:hypothetical protein